LPGHAPNWCSALNEMHLGLNANLTSDLVKPDNDALDRHAYMQRAWVSSSGRH